MPLEVIFISFCLVICFPFASSHDFQFLNSVWNHQGVQTLKCPTAGRSAEATESPAMTWLYISTYCRNTAIKSFTKLDFPYHIMMIPIQGSTQTLTTLCCVGLGHWAGGLHRPGPQHVRGVRWRPEGRLQALLSVRHSRSREEEQAWDAHRGTTGD